MLKMNILTTYRLPLIQWDRLADVLSMHSDVMRNLANANGSGGISLNDRVCVLKQAARIIVLDKG